MTITRLSHDLRHAHPCFHLCLLHEEGVENGDIVREHVDVQFVLSLEVVDELSQRHLTAILLHTIHVKTIPQGPLNVIVLGVYVGERERKREREREREREGERE